jgi:hypothetical protein
MFGYTGVAQVAKYAAPWMILVFIAAAIAVLPALGIGSFSEFWPVANQKIWTGMPLAGQSKFTFWHVMFFAWFCNLAMHKRKKSRPVQAERDLSSYNSILYLKFN